jgi:hypothetical protein
VVYVESLWFKTQRGEETIPVHQGTPVDTLNPKIFVN